MAGYSWSSSAESSVAAAETAAEAVAETIGPGSSPSAYTSNKHIVRRRPSELKGYSKIGLAQWHGHKISG